MRRIMLATAVAAAAVLPVAAQAQEARGKGPSAYLRCDGQPNNMTGAESFARFLGGITLLALFAPAPEQPDPAKRQFGDKGVDACTQVIDGAKAEGNPLRRVPLILARALHHIEAKNYTAAIADVDKARGEAKAASLAGNPYFDRSMGLAFSNIEGQARLRMNDPAGAQRASYAAWGNTQYSFVPSVSLRDYSKFLRTLTPEAEQKLAANARIVPVLLLNYAEALDEVGRFADSAHKHDSYLALLDTLKLEKVASGYYAKAALAHALAGNAAEAKARLASARDNLARRRAEGVPEANAAAVVEITDLADIVLMMQGGDMATARRNFAARSQWMEPSFGSVMEVNRRLREGAAPAELTGSLATTPDELWQRRFDEMLAVELQSDTDNKSLWQLIPRYADISEFEGRTAQTWRVAKSRMMDDKPVGDSGRSMISQGGSLHTSIDSIMLHAALQAKAKGKDGFSISVVVPSMIPGQTVPFSAGFVRFVDENEMAGHEALFIPAAAVIAELEQVIPSPALLQQRKKARSR